MLAAYKYTKSLSASTVVAGLPALPPQFRRQGVCKKRAMHLQATLSKDQRNARALFVGCRCV